jgi:hypothetical protein
VGGESDEILREEIEAERVVERRGEGDIGDD